MRARGLTGSLEQDKVQLPGRRHLSGRPLSMPSSRSWPPTHFCHYNVMNCRTQEHVSRAESTPPLFCSITSLLVSLVGGWPAGWLFTCDQVRASHGRRRDGRMRRGERARSGISLPVAIKIDRRRRRSGEGQRLEMLAGRPATQSVCRSVGRSVDRSRRGSLPLRDFARLRPPVSPSLAVTGQFSPLRMRVVRPPFTLLASRVGSRVAGQRRRERQERVRHGHFDHPTLTPLPHPFPSLPLPIGIFLPSWLIRG